jgi:xanthine/uracil permease
MKIGGKTHIVISVIVTLIGTLLIPVFFQWWEQQTGIYPYGTLGFCVLLSLINFVVIIIISDL